MGSSPFPFSVSRPASLKKSLELTRPCVLWCAALGDADGSVNTARVDVQVLLNPQDFDWVLASSGIPKLAIPIGQDVSGQDLYAAVYR